MSSETSAADEAQSGILNSSQVSLRPLVPSASQPSNVQQVQTTAFGHVSSESVTAGRTEVTLNTSVPLMITDPCLVQQPVAQPKNAETSSNTSLLRNEANREPQRFSGLDRSIGSTREVIQQPVVAQPKNAGTPSNTSVLRSETTRIQRSCSRLDGSIGSTREVVHQPAVARPKNAGTSFNTSLSRNEATRVQRSSTGLDGSIGSTRQTSSPEIDVLPAVKRVKIASDHDTASVEFVDKLQRASNDCSAGAVEPDVSRSSVHRCGSPGLDEDGEFSHHKLKPVPAAVTHSQSNTAGGVKLIPLSQVMSTSISSDAVAKRPSAKLSCVDQTSVKAADKKSSNNEMLSQTMKVSSVADNKSSNNQLLSQSLPASSAQADSVWVPKATRRRSTRLRVTKSVSGHATHCAVDETKSMKFDVTSGDTEPTDKENICTQRTTPQRDISSRQPSQQENRETSRLSAKSRASNSSLSGEESDVSSAEVRRCFVKCAQQDTEPIKQRLPTAWEKPADNSPIARRRSSDRIKQTESVAQPSEGKKSPGAVTGIKRSASSSSSGLSSCEKKSAKKVTRTIAMTSLHTE